jgi:predicted metal-dependent phosphoesterase TrpH
MTSYKVEADLHLHTNHSDGTLTPKELLVLCKKRNLKLVSITDHDTTAGISEAKQIAADIEIDFIPGIELGAYWEESEIHILGYYVNPDDSHLQKILSDFRDNRISRGASIVKKLREMGLNISFERVEEISKGGSIGRPHIAQALMESGYIKTPKEAFDKFIGDRNEGFVPRKLLSLEDSIKLLTRNGALPVLAHPLMSSAKSGRKGILGLSKLLPIMKEWGLVGMEIYYGTYRNNQKRKLLDLANEYSLIPCGGSDYHAVGNPIEPEPGDVGPPLYDVDRLIELHE